MTKTVLAHQKFIRQTPRKMRLVADMVRHMSVEEALVQLQVSSKTAAQTLRNVMIQARANAQNIGLRLDSLKIKTILIEEGPTQKRWRPVSRGRAHSILKRTCHIKVTLEGSDAPVVKPASTTTSKKTTKETKKGSK